MTLRIALLGCGGIARLAHLPSLRRLAGVRITALADADAARLASVRALVPDAAGHAAFGDALLAPDVDAVIIALPPALHAAAAVAAFEHGKHVYLEKPLATSVDEGARVLRAWEQSGLVGMMGFNYRRNALVARARAALAAGALGAPVAARTVFSTSARTEPAWKAARQTGGGALLDLAVHHVDLLRFLFDAEIIDVHAELRSRRDEDDTALLHMRLTSGCDVQSFFSLGSVEEDRIEIYGSQAKLTIDRYGSLVVDVAPAAAGGALGGAVRRLARECRALPYALERLRSPGHEPSFPAALEAFVAAVGGAPATPDLLDGYRALAVVEAAETSARTGRAAAPRPAPGRADETPRAVRRAGDRRS